MSWDLRTDRRDVVRSTMEEAAALADAGATEGTTVVANEQTGGRGRHGREWYSPRGAGLWLTTILRPHDESAADASSAATLSLVAAVATWRTLRRGGAADVRIKWPNDLVVAERKLGGILLERRGHSSERQYVLVGIGINLAAGATLRLSSELAPLYVGLADCVPPPHPALGAAQDRLLAELLSELEACYHRWQVDGLEEVLAEWPRADALAGTRVRVNDGISEHVGIANGIAIDGALRLHTGDDDVFVTAGEVVRVRNAGG